MSHRLEHMGREQAPGFTRILRWMGDFIGDKPGKAVEFDEYRVRCSCGWTEKAHTEVEITSRWSLHKMGVI